MRVVVMPPDPVWPTRFREEAERLSAIFGMQALYIHHIGSTSVGGLAAKPIIDILPVVRDIALVDSLTPAMEELGYEALGEYGLPGRRYFRKGAEFRTHHVHVYERGNPEISRHLALRDYLRSRPALAERYAALKRLLAEGFPNDIEGYMSGKDAFLKEAEAEALAWWTRLPALALSGPVGVGKTTIAYALSERLSQRDIANAVADLDALSEIAPRSPKDRFATGFSLANLRDLTVNARSCGARCLIIPRVLETLEDVDDIRSAVPWAEIIVVRLRAPLSVLEERLRRRERGASLEWHIRRAGELSMALDQSGPADHVVAAGEGSPEELADEILERTGVLRLLG